MGLGAILPFLQQYQPPPPDPSQGAPAQAPPTTAPPAVAPPAPQQTKAHKLLQILQGGLVGGLSGLAANAQTYAATGRNAGFGGGVGAGFTQSLPLQAQLGSQELKQKQAQTKLTESQSEMVLTPYGPLPPALAKMIFPALISAGAKTGAAQIGATAKENVAQTQAQTQERIHRYIPVQGVGLFDAQTKQLMPDTGQGITVTPEIAADHGLPQEFVGKPMKLSDFNSMMRFENQQTTTVQGQNGPALVNKKTAAVTPLGLGNPGMGRPMEVGNPNAPGETQVTTGAQAVASGAPGKSSASVQVPKKAAASEVPTNIGNQKVAFTTAVQHADLLRQAVKALGNGDQQTLNGLQNRFANEFGATGPITAQVIADAYGREVTAMLSKGHMTDSEIQTVGKTVDPLKQNYKQIDSVLNGYQALAKSKMNMLNQQKQNAVNQSQPNKSAGSVSVSDMLKKYPPVK